MFKSSVDILKALYMLKRALWLVKTAKIFNFFRKAGFAGAAEAISDMVEERVDFEVTGVDASEFEQLVEIDDEVVCYGELDDTEIIAAMADPGATLAVAVCDIDDSTPPA